MTRAGWTLLLGAVVLWPACHHPPPPIVDADLCFQLRWPGRGWSLLDLAESRAVVPAAVAGARLDGAVTGIVLVEPLDARDLEGVARTLDAAHPLRAKKVSPFTRLEVAGERALRWETTAMSDGVPVRYQHTILGHQQHLYQLVVMATGDDTRRDGAELAAFAAAFSFLPGTVRDRAQAVRVPDSDGVGWRVRAGVYESAACGVRVNPRRGWRVAVGESLRRMNASAEFGLAGDEQAFIVALPESAPPEGEREAYVRGLIQARVESGQASLAPISPEVAVGGASLTMAEYTTGGPVPLRFLHGVLFHGRNAIQIIGWTGVGQGEAGRASLLEGLSSIELLDEPARTRLIRELEGKVDPVSQVGATFSFHQDVYRDFANGFSFRRRGLWRVAAGDRARQHHQNAVLWLDQPALGLFGYVAAPSGTSSLEEVHARVVADRLRRTAAPVAFQVGGRAALRSTGPVQLEAARLQWEVVSVIESNHEYEIHVWGRPPDVAAARPDIDELLGGFRWGGEELAPPGERNGRYEDRRMGFSFRPPGDSWRRQDRTPGGMSAIGSMMRWSRPGYEVLVGGVGVNGGAASPAMQAIEAQMIRSLGGPAERGPAVIAGAPARKSRGRSGLRWLETYVFERDGIAYIIVLSAPFIGHGSFFQQGPAGFAFLD
jgi:hypothetical protein